MSVYDVVVYRCSYMPVDFRMSLLRELAPGVSCRDAIASKNDKDKESGIYGKKQENNTGVLL